MKLPKISMNNEHIETSYIPERFYKEIGLHIFKNWYANKHHNYHTPLILAISGPPGMGKTYQTQKVLDFMGIKKFIMSGTEFESKNAGVPAENMQKMYKEISEDIFYKKIEYGAIVIDDADAAIGKWDGLVQYTMNRQLIIKSLIDIADNPFELRIIDDNGSINLHETCRIPFIITLNDETKMYEPLIRNGRTVIFPWKPEEKDIIPILDNIFDGIIFVDENEHIIHNYNLYIKILKYAKEEAKIEINELPIALFADIKSKLLDDSLWKKLHNAKSFISAESDFLKLLNSKLKFGFSNALDIGIKLLRYNNNYLNNKNEKEIIKVHKEDNFICFQKQQQTQSLNQNSNGSC